MFLCCVTDSTLENEFEDVFYFHKEEYEYDN